jgi:putative tryptophan/tyrosine transport system substrate-binding protein
MPPPIGRRELIAGLGSALAWSVAARAQQPAVRQPAAKKRMVIISWVPDDGMKIGGDPLATVFLEELKRLGYVEGDNLVIERHQFRPAGIAELAREVVDTNPDVIVCYCTPMTAALKSLTSTIPIVAYTGDPIRFRLISSLAHPGGNITGVSVDAGIDVWGKRLELLSRVVPKLANVLFVSTQGGWKGAGGDAVRSAAQKLQISIVQASLNPPFDEAEWTRILSSVQHDQVDGAIVADESQLEHLYPLVIRSLEQMHIPAIYPMTEQAEAGGLMSYGQDIKSTLRIQVAQLVQVLHGVNPADIPYFQATEFQLVINMKAAKELGIEVPAGLIAGATSVIE